MIALARLTRGSADPRESRLTYPIRVVESWAERLANIEEHRVRGYRAKLERLEVQEAIAEVEKRLENVHINGMTVIDPNAAKEELVEIDREVDL